MLFYISAETNKKFRREYYKLQRIQCIVESSRYISKCCIKTFRLYYRYLPNYTYLKI